MSQQQEQTTFKVYFENEIRRISLPTTTPTLASLQSLLKTILPESFHPELTIQYTDEDNDRITVTSELEWIEALKTMSAEKIKKIYIVSNKKGGFFKDAPAPKPRYFYESNSNMKIPKGDRSVEKLKKSVPACLEKLFDGGKILPHNIPEWLQSVIKVNVIEPGTDTSVEVVDLDIDITRLKPVLHHRAISLLDTRQYSESRRILKALLKIDPNSPLHLYNLGCVNALDGKPKAACKNLQKSVDFGYNNLDHMLRDSDLDSLRLRPEYLKIIDQLRAQNESVAAEEKEEIAAPIEEKFEQMSIDAEPEAINPMEEVTEEKQVEFDENLTLYEKEMQILRDMGFDDVNKNLALLVLANGDLATVLNRLFE